MFKTDAGWCASWVADHCGDLDVCLVANRTLRQHGLTTKGHGTHDGGTASQMRLSARIPLLYLRSAALSLLEAALLLKLVAEMLPGRKPALNSAKLFCAPSNAAGRASTAGPGLIDVPVEHRMGARHRDATLREGRGRSAYMPRRAAAGPSAGEDLFTAGNVVIASMLRFETRVTRPDRCPREHIGREQTSMFTVRRRRTR